MKTTKITGAEIAPLKIASLPSRPTAPTAFGGRGYSASEMKEAFDKLPLFIIERLNLLLDDITDGELLSALPTGYTDGHTVKDLIDDIRSGRMAAYLDVLGAPLTDVIQSLRESLARSESGDTELRALVAGIVEDLAFVSGQIDGLSTNSENEHDRLDSRIDSAEQRAAETDAKCEEELNKIKQRLGECETERLDLGNSLFNIESDVAGLKRRAETLESDLGDVSSALDELHAYAVALSGGEEA